ncbi:NRDE family protein [Aidingimonas lacisalsi]|uniref:NRDE family protein n=1 Tax=Aidingimonas lacisalsi TaxID=2604086 RepID=UPI0011D1C2D0|nr:NRDE family protein [Aidingimonas lacisalsi]
MCLIAFDFRPEAAIRLRLIANRDEFHARDTAPLSPWQETPDIVGGRDLVAGGGWLAVHRRGRLAAVTNVRDTALVPPADPPSRGQLVRDALECDDLPAWLDQLATRRAAAYAGFNLLTSDGEHVWHLHHGHGTPQLLRVPPGQHAISNASLDTPWPKTERARRGLAWCLTSGRWPDDALDVMGDSHQESDDSRLPETGIGLARERELSPLFIVGDDYGTRAMTWLTWHADGHIDMAERRYGPGGQWLGETALSLDMNNRA